MKISLGVSNLRSLAHVEPIEIRPLTILVGANNSGKTTFLRTFALLRQSLEENIVEPILWNDSCVDFGDFTTAVRNGDKSLEISFQMKFSELALDQGDNSPPTKPIAELYAGNSTVENAAVSYYVGITNDNSYLKCMEIHIEEFSLTVSIKFEVGSEKIEIFINDKKVNWEAVKNFGIKKNGIFRQFEGFVRGTMNNIMPLKNYGDCVTEFFAREMYTIVSRDTSDSKDTERDKGSREFAPHFLDISNVLVRAYPLDTEKLNRILSNYAKSNDNFQFNSLLARNCTESMSTICEISALNFTFQLLGAMEKDLRNYFLSSSNLASLRSYYTRTFALKGLDVSKIAVDGRNVSMFLLSLKETGKLDDFSHWTNETVGYKFDIEKGIGNVSINVIEGDSKINLIDSGFGLANLLPVLAQVWLSTIGMNDNLKSKHVLPFQLNSNPVCIEEPELHLHQRLQARLADVFVNALEKRNKEEVQPSFIVETHSEVLLNRLGELIEKRKINHKDVQVILFDKKTGDLNSTKVSTASFNADGALINWPYGFMYY